MTTVIRTDRQTVVVPSSPVGSPGAKGDPGGNVMAIGLLKDAGALTIPAGTTLVQTSGNESVGVGVGRYTEDAAITSGYLASFPKAGFRDSAGRGFRVISEEPLNPQKFYKATDPDFDAAMHRMIDYARDIGAASMGLSDRAYEVRVDRNSYDVHSSFEFDFTVQMIGRGGGSGGGGAATTFNQSADVPTFITQQYNTSGVSGSKSASSARGSGSKFRGIGIKGPNLGTEGSGHGWLFRAPTTLEDVSATLLSGDPVHGDSSDTLGNLNQSKVTDFFFSGCGGTGLAMNGSNAQVCTFADGTITGMKLWGLNDDALMANVYDNILIENCGFGLVNSYSTSGGNRYAAIAGQETWCSTHAPSGTTADNQGWAYIGAGGAATGFVTWTSGLTWRAAGAGRTQSPNAPHQLRSLYLEGSQGRLQVVTPTLVIGGVMGPGNPIGTGVYLEVIAPGQWTVHGDYAIQCPGDTTPTAFVNSNGINLGTGKFLWKNGQYLIGTRVSGWTPATGTATRGTFDTATVTLPQLAEHVKALIDDFHSSSGNMGLLGT